MARGRKRRESSPLKIVAIVLAVLVILAGVLVVFLLFAGTGGGSNPVTRKINKEVSKKAVETYVSSETGVDVDIDEIEESMAEEDADKFNEIMDKYSDSGLVSDAMSIYRENGGDISATAAELQEKINPEDLETIKELYKKYGASVPLE
ncbi:MAG: hypothetical protein J6N76_07845 [Lachnospiraceae bacterium]|nr:hypothetical protein [Lachnospiraceae bacterium]